MYNFIIWTTFVCLNGEILDTSFMPGNMYSSNVYSTMEQVNNKKEEWRNIYKGWGCIPFMIQHEEITSQLILKHLLNIRF